jgi:hypothetical protein
MAHVLSKREFSNEFDKDGKLYQFVVLLDNSAGALAKAASVLERNNLATLSGFHYADLKNNWEEWSFFVDFSKTSVTPEQLSAELSSDTVVKKVQFRQSEFPDLAMDDAHFPIIIGEDARAAVFKATTMRIAIQKLWDVFGTGAATILWEIGRAAGELEAQEMKEKLRLNQIEAVKYILEEKRANGWFVGELADIKTSPTRLVLTVENSFECEHKGSKQGEPRSFFLKGYLGSYISSVFEKQLKIKETRCKAKGDNFCEFQIIE